MNFCEELELEKYECLEEFLEITKRMLDIPADDAIRLNSEIENREKIIVKIDDINVRIKACGEPTEKELKLALKNRDKVNEIIRLDKLIAPNVSMKIRELKSKHDEVKNRIETKELDFSKSRKEKGYFLNIKG